MDYEKIFFYLQNLNENTQLKTFYDEVVGFENIYFIPAIRFDVALFLNLISFLKQPKNVLEIGFGSGVSALFIQKDLISQEIFITLERDKKRYERGTRLLKKLENSTLNLLNLDAFDFFKQNNNQFDLVFIDAVKKDYIDYFKIIKDRLNPNGIIICDNIFFNGKIIEENLPEKYEKGVALLKEFNQTLSNDKSFFTQFLPIGDGISISIKK
ncbi:MAG: hypothetical protein A2086_03135 [Spirochaetes bacterium GWD1_27_9]|nr:MAG: hypothetical protein A2Z98_00465 [Spirochaetes bacterium GWB1_27_13]OHD21302.1 MAG: hypothetical protein A2Y34_06465 [Spirochaetes bacterium GWC1_27_15]OHD39796.1 MAG: hypothetical protein A2086_03135 [Spirochaetes bacterium GWD1_27_9]